MNSPLSLELSAMRRRDLKAVMAIEREAFPEPWSMGVFTSELALKEERAYRVARDARVLAGYFGMMFVEEEAHVTTIAVAMEYQRRGVATMLMLEVARLARERGTRHISLEVAAKNEPAQRLYRRFGFAPVGVRKRYYPATGEDAYVMWAYDIDSPAYEDRLATIEARLRSR